MTKRAIIHVENTENILEFADYLANSGWTILTANKTEELLRKQKIPVIREQALVENTLYVTDTSQLVRRILQTKYEEDNPYYEEDELEENNIFIVCMNLTPSMNDSAANKPNETNICPSDFFISTILRSSFANYENVLILTDPADYKEAMIQLKTGGITKDFRTYLAAKALNLVSAYDGGISASVLQSQIYDEHFMNYLMYPFKKELPLQRGANTQQNAFLYRSPTDFSSTGNFLKLPGKELPYNLVSDICYAWGQISNLYSILKDQYMVKSINSDGYNFTTQFTPLTGTVFTIAVKFNTITGAGLSTNVLDSFKKTYTYDVENTDDVVFACSAVIDAAAATEIVKCPFAAIVAPSFTNDAKQILSMNKTIRLIPSGKISNISMDGKLINGGIILQTRDSKMFNHWKVKSKNRPSQDKTDEMAFGMSLLMGARSYSAVLIKNNAIVGISQGCTSTSKAIEGVFYEAIQHVIRTEGQEKLDEMKSLHSMADVLVCDAAVSFSNTLKELIDYGVSAIIQTGGTPTDNEFIDYCNERGIILIFTDMTHISF